MHGWTDNCDYGKQNRRRQLMAHHYGHAALSVTVSFMRRVLLDSSCLSPAFQNVYIMAEYRNSPFPSHGTSMDYPCWRTKEIAVR